MGRLRRLRLGSMRFSQLGRVTGGPQTQRTQTKGRSPSFAKPKLGDRPLVFATTPSLPRDAGGRPGAVGHLVGHLVGRELGLQVGQVLSGLAGGDGRLALGAHYVRPADAGDGVLDGVLLYALYGLFVTAGGDNAPLIVVPSTDEMPEEFSPLAVAVTVPSSDLMPFLPSAVTVPASIVTLPCPAA